MQMFTSARNKKTRTFCPDCADTNKEVRVELAKAHTGEELEISDDSEEIEGQICETCQRSIASVPALQGVFRLKVHVTFTVEVDLQAKSATDAEYQLEVATDGANFDSIMEDIKTTLEGELDDPETVNVDECEYHVAPAKRVPPDQNMFVSPTQERMRSHL